MYHESNDSKSITDSIPQLGGSFFLLQTHEDAPHQDRYRQNQIKRRPDPGLALLLLRGNHFKRAMKQPLQAKQHHKSSQDDGDIPDEPLPRHSPHTRSLLRKKPGGRASAPPPEAFCVRCYSVFSTPVASLKALISSSRSLAWAWTASHVPSVSYQRASSSSAVLPCCSTQV